MDQPHRNNRIAHAFIANGGNARVYRSISSSWLFDIKSLGVAVKYEPLTSDEANFQYGLCPLNLRMREAVDESVAFKHRIPDGRKIISVPHQFCASLR